MDHKLLFQGEQTQIKKNQIKGVISTPNDTYYLSTVGATNFANYVKTIINPDEFIIKHARDWARAYA